MSGARQRTRQRGGRPGSGPSPRIRGITRPTLDADYIRAGTFALPAANVSLIVEAIGTAGDLGAPFAIAFAATAAFIQVAVGSASTQRLAGRVSVAGTSDPAALLLVTPEILDGTTRWFALATYDGSTFRLHYAKAGEWSVLSGSSAGSGSLAGTATLHLHERTGGLGVAGAVEAKVLSRVIDVDEFRVIANNSQGIALLDGDAATLGQLYPAIGQVEDAPITSTAQLVGTGTVAITAGTADCTIGGLNG